MTRRETAATGFSHFPHECQPGSRRAQSFLMKKFRLANSGCLNEYSSLSNGGWSWHKYGKAIDLGAWWHDAEDKADGDACFSYVLAHANDFGLQQMIWGNKIVDIRDGYKVRRYTRSDHYNHLHIALSYDASQRFQPPVDDDVIPHYPPEYKDDPMLTLLRGDQQPHVFRVSDRKTWLLREFHVDSLLAPQPPIARLATVPQATMDSILYEVGTKKPDGTIAKEGDH